MNSFNNYEEYNYYLITNNIQITIKDYIKYLAINIYNVNVSFMDDLISLLIKKEIHIHHSKLEEYGVITPENNSNNINRIIKRNGLEKERDWKIFATTQGVAKSGRGGSNKKIIIFIQELLDYY